MDTERILSDLNREAGLADQRAAWDRILRAGGWQQQPNPQLCALGVLTALAQGQPVVVRKRSRWQRVTYMLRHGLHDWLHRDCGEW
jgi:hypothetical protein